MNALREIRKSNHLTQKEMAFRLGVSLSLYTKLENKYRTPSQCALKKIKSAFPDTDMNIFFNNRLHVK